MKLGKALLANVTSAVHRLKESNCIYYKKVSAAIVERLKEQRPNLRQNKFNLTSYIV